MKKFLFLLFIGLTPNFLLLLALYIFDPLQLYHKPFFRDKYLIDNNMRYQAAGIINTWNFNSVILGTSMLQNTSNREASEKLGGKWVNLSIAGGSLYERSVLLDYLFLNKNISQVILSLEPFIPIQKINLQHDVDFFYLYDSNRINDFKIYFNEIYLMCMLHISNACFQTDSEDYPTAWFHNRLFNQTFNGFNFWIRKSDNKEMKEILQNILHPSLKETQNTKQLVLRNLSDNLVRLIKQNSKTKFYLIIPPFSTLYYKLNNSNKNWSIWKEGLMFILQEKLPNLQIFGFDNEYFTNHIKRYKDPQHYDEKVNSFMLDAIKNDTHRITLENIDSYFEEMRKKVEAYDIEPLRKQIIESGVLDK